MDDSGYYPSNSVPLAQLFSCLLGSLTATHRTIIEFATMPFHKSLLLALLGASTVLCRSLVNLDHGPNDMLSESSVPAFVGRPQDLLEDIQPINPAGVVPNGPSHGGILPGNLPDEDPEKNSGKGKHSGDEGKGHPKIAEQEKTVNLLRQQLDEAITKLASLEDADTKPFDGEEEKGRHPHHRGGKHPEPDHPHAPDTNSPTSPQGTPPAQTSSDHLPGQQPVSPTKRSTIFPDSSPTKGEEDADDSDEDGSEIDIAHIPADDQHHHPRHPRRPPSA
ncbi:hypothetical protein PCANC_11785 [Puccinia coronata f. sp. avenae]|uniref:Uncharacterized protein n=1 Tax=Puccinia coronata f. sp. avenae TaxID=200324 RepID=A0A2N5SV64_9BASI|nr:hypothetical protein PCANC_11785 [Puccinia coronata f. sp. avenae]